jgi:hypothetical protein
MSEILIKIVIPFLVEVSQLSFLAGGDFSGLDSDKFKVRHAAEIRLANDWPRSDPILRNAIKSGSIHASNAADRIRTGCIVKYLGEHVWADWPYYDAKNHTWNMELMPRYRDKIMNLANVEVAPWFYNKDFESYRLAQEIITRGWIRSGVPLPFVKLCYTIGRAVEKDYKFHQSGHN